MQNKTDFKVEVRVARTSGFCFGVKRAIDTVYEQLKNDDIIYTYGPIIHNEDVVKELEQKGVSIIEGKEQAFEVEKGTVIIRAHGIPESQKKAIEAAGHKIVDATCPFVLKIHKIVREATEKGEFVVIIGDEKHPEVQGIMGAAVSNCIAIDSEEQAYYFLKNNENRNKKLCIVSQTTFNFNKFKYLVDIFQKNSYDSIGVLNTICNATEERQTEAEALAADVDAMIVIGGRNSSNTQKLYDICRKVCEHTFYIQNADDMDYAQLCGMSRVGITAGASTPNRIIEEVQKRCQI